MAEPDKKEEEEPIVAVLDEEEEQSPTPGTQNEDAEDQDEDDGHQDDDDEEEETRLGAGEPDDDELKARRKEERKTRRQRQKEARERDSREMNFLRKRNEDLERRFSAVEQRQTSTEVSTIDQRINHITSQIKLADQVIAKAVSAGQGEDLVEAQGIRDDLRDNLAELNYAKQTISERETGPTEEQPARVSSTLMNYANDFTSKHNWWDPNGGDEDSLIVSAIDNSLAREAYDPETKEYWDELSRRVQARLPHRFETGGEQDQGDTGGRGGKRQSRGPKFSTGGRERPLKSNEVYISPARKEAMVEAGIWDDPEQRQRYLKQYAEYDREHGTSPGA